ncbi:MAG: hypothetical protein ACOCSK_01005 [Rhodothermales bacterium]
MRYFLLLFALIVFIGTATPAQAQLRNQVQALTKPASAQLYDASGPGFSLNKLFSPQVFTMGHSYEMSVGSYGGASSSLGMYTNTMLWQFSPKLDARVDVSVAHSFTGNHMGDNSPAQVFLRNAEINFRPNESTQFHISFRQSPYGTYASPYGSYGHFVSPHRGLPPIGR